jgi:hypothetical protein
VVAFFIAVAAVSVAILPETCNAASVQTIIAIAADRGGRHE